MLGSHRNTSDLGAAYIGSKMETRCVERKKRRKEGETKKEKYTNKEGKKGRKEKKKHMKSGRERGRAGFGGRMKGRFDQNTFYAL